MWICIYGSVSYTHLDVYKRQVYRMLNVLEEIGAVDRRSYQMVEEEKESVSIIFNHGETDEKNRELYQKIKRILRENGCLGDQEFSMVIRVES